MNLNRIIAYLRWRAFQTAARLTLGERCSGWLFGRRVVTTPMTMRQHDEVERAVEAEVLLAPAERCDYDFGPDYPQWFPRTAVFEPKRMFVISSATIVPGSSAIVLRDGDILERSLIGWEVFMQGGMFESMDKFRAVDGEEPVFPFPTYYAYYHELIEVMTALLQCSKVHPELRIALRKKRPAFVDGLLEFFGFDRKRWIEEDVPIKVKRCLHVPYVEHRSFVRPGDAEFLRGEILNRLGTTGAGRKIYISRRGAPSRHLVNECELEDLLEKDGFEICRFEALSVSEQFRKIAEADFVVAVHGSGLANLVAARRGTRVLEIISPEWRRSTFARMSKELGLVYDWVMAETGNGGFTAPLDAIATRVR